ncbi:hypothetical protein CHS0354_002765 [Potamilus streckersoni]|uniref:Uncharacterized protein n=1 Tax=Potamilus streckersoni TaxID=2493646 RepID=A0AAE0SNY1_9BIVA|nr:hypothetical protein CHS0354_002765 [Potamilus streckersoni]
MSTDKTQNMADLNLQFEAWLRRKGGFDMAHDDETKKNSQIVTINAKDEVLRHLRENSQRNQIQGQKEDNSATQNSTGSATSVTVDGSRNGVQAQENKQRSDLEWSEVITTRSGPKTSTIHPNPVETATILQTAAVGQTPPGTDQAPQEQPSSDVLYNSTVTGIITQQSHVGGIQCNQPPPSSDSGPITVTISQSNNNISQSGPEEMCRPLRGGPLLPPIRQRAIPVPDKKVEPTTIALYTDTRRDRPRFNLLKQELLNHPDRRKAPDSEVDWHVVSQQEIDHLLNIHAEQALLRQDQFQEDACTSIFVVDASLSMREQSMRNLKETIRTYVLGNNSHPFADNMGLVIFGPKIKVAQYLTSDKILFLSKLDEITTGGMSDLPTALKLTSALFVRETRPKFAGLELRPRIFILSDFLVSRLPTDDYCGSEPAELKLHLEVAEVIDKLREKHNCDIYSVPIGKIPVLKLADQVGYESIGGQLHPVELHRYSKSYIHYKILGHLIARKDERLGKDQLMRMAKELKIDKYVTDKDLDVMMKLARRFAKARVSYPNQEEDPDYVKIAPNLAANQLITSVIILKEISADEVIAAIIQDKDEEIPNPITDHLPIMPSIGTRVRPGPDFMWRTPEITDFMEGEVTQICIDTPGWLQVRWENGVVNEYRYGLDLEFDVVPVNGDIDGIQWKQGEERLVQDFTYGIRDDDPYAGDLIIQLRREIKDYPPMPGYFICQDFPPWPLNILPRPASKPAPQLRDGLPRFLVEYFTDPDMIPSDDDDSLPDRDMLRRKRNREWTRLRRETQALATQQNQSDDDNFSASQPGNENYYSNTSQQPADESNSTKQTSVLAQMPISMSDSSRETSVNSSSSVNSAITPTILSAQSSAGPNMPLAQNSVKPAPSIEQVPVNTSASFAESSVDSTVLSADIDSSPVVSHSSFNSAVSSVNGTISPAISGLATPRNYSEPLRKSWSQLLNSGSGLDLAKKDTSKPKQLLSSSALFTHQNTEPSIKAAPSTFSSPQSAINLTITSTPTSVTSTQSSAVLSSQLSKSNNVTPTKSWAQLLNSSAGRNPGKPLKSSMQEPTSVISSLHNTDTLISSLLSVNSVISSSQTSTNPTISSEQSLVSHISPAHAEGIISPAHTVGIHTISSTEVSDTSTRTWSQLLNSRAGSVLDSNSTSSSGKSASPTSASWAKMDENISSLESPLSGSDANTRSWSQLLNSGVGANSVNIDSKPGKISIPLSTEVKHTIQPFGMHRQQGKDEVSENQHGLRVQTLAGQSETIAKKTPSWSMLFLHNPSTDNSPVEESSNSSSLWKGIPASDLRSNEAAIVTQNRSLDEARRNSNGSSSVSLGQMAEPSSGTEHSDFHVKNKPPSWSDLLGKGKESPIAPLGMSSKNVGLPHPHAGSTIVNTATDKKNTPAEQLSLGKKTKSLQDQNAIGDNVASQNFMRVDLENISRVRESQKTGSAASFMRKETTGMSKTYNLQTEDQLSGTQRSNEAENSSSDNDFHQTRSATHNVLCSVTTTVPLQNTKDTGNRPTGQRSVNKDPSDCVAISSLHNNSNRGMQQSAGDLAGAKGPLQNVEVSKSCHQGKRAKVQDHENRDSVDASHNMLETHKDLVRTSAPSLGKKVSRLHPKGQRLTDESLQTQDKSSGSNSSGDESGSPDSSSETTDTRPVRQMKLQPKDKKSADLVSQTTVGSESSHNNSSISGEPGTLVNSARASAWTSLEQVSRSQSHGQRSKSKKASQKLSVSGVPSASNQWPATSLHHGGDSTSSVNSQTTELQHSDQKLTRQRLAQNFIVSGAHHESNQRRSGSSFIGKKPSLNSPGFGSQPIGQRSSESSSSSSSPVNNDSSEMNTPNRRSEERWVYSSDIGPGASEEASWSCPRCTYMNSNSFPTCEMCYEERGSSAGLVQRDIMVQQLMDFFGLEGQGQMTDDSESEDESQTLDRPFRQTDDPGYQGQVIDRSEPEENRSASTLLVPSQHESLQTPLTRPGQQPDNTPIPKVVHVETVVEQVTTSLELVRTENNLASPVDTESEESSFEEGTGKSNNCMILQNVILACG